MRQIDQTNDRVSSWVRCGAVWVRETDSTALLSPQRPTSFLADFAFSLNPLAGCPFGCTDCYVPALPSVKFRPDQLPDGRDLKRASTWGSWVEVRVKSVDVLRAALEQGKLNGARLMMSPLTDVYWSGEKEYEITQGILKLLAERPVFDWLVISTRSDLVERDIDLLQHLGDKVEVGITIPTDREDVKRVLGAHNPSLERRFRIARKLVAAGIPTRIHVAPLQPHTPDFLARLADAGHWIWLDWHTHLGAGFVPSFAPHGWSISTPEDVEAFAEQLRRRMGQERVRVGQAHFADRWGAIQAALAPGGAPSAPQARPAAPAAPARSAVITSPARREVPASRAEPAAAGLKRPGEAIALHLRDHQTSISDWEYVGLARELHRWVGLFDLEFKLQLPAYPVLEFEPLRNAYATYEWGRGELGTKDNITFNTSELDRDPALTIRTLCHEVLHLWQHYHGTPPTSKSELASNYHNCSATL